MISTLVALVSMAAFCAGSPASLVLREPAVGSTGAWVDLGRASPESRVEVVFAVRQRNLEVLEQKLYAVSDPKSAFYGQHLSKAAVDKLVAPAASSLVRVEAFLRQFGLRGSFLSANGDFVGVNTTVAVAEAMLGAEYHEFALNKSRILRTPAGYSLPASVAGDIDFVAPTTRFPATPTLRVTSLTAPSSSSSSFSTSSAPSTSSSDSGVDPSFLRTLYSVPSGLNGTVGSNRQAFASFLGEFFSLDDAQTFFGKYAPWESGVQPTVLGPNQQSQVGLEASLDVQYIMAMGAGTPTDAWSTAGQQPGSPDNEPFLTWLMHVSNMSDDRVAKAISVSYGDNENTVVYDYATRVNAEFAKLGARGISILFSSGDGGVAGSQPSQCPHGFIPTFPAASPYVTAVGGTTGSGPEVAAGLSGGGFSNYWPRPDYQDKAVEGYFSVAKDLPPSSDYNHSGAGFPDVAAQAEGFVIVANGNSMQVAGTSCSSPTFTGVLSLVNAARIAAGKATLGWLNPLIYQNPDLFNDVTQGNNPGCGTDGFHAAAGWDPVTGMGSIDYQKLVQHALQKLP